MIAAIRAFFEQNFGSEAPSEQDIDQQIAMATAALMFEVTLADQTLDAEERQHIVGLLQATTSLEPQQLEHLMQLALEEVRESTDLFQFTRLINQHFDEHQREALVRNLWRVAWADGEIHHYEEHLIRRIADLLHLHHHHFIRAKLQARDQASAVEVP